MDQKKNGRPGFDRRMSRAEINCCPIRRWEGRTIVVRDSADLEKAIDKLASESLLGFDTETRPAYRKGESYPPSLLQLAGRDEVFIFQLNHLGLAAPLRQLLADPDVIKTGVGLDFDIRELQKLSRFMAAGFFDLGNLAREKGIRNHGLRGLAAVFLGVRIPKGAQTSNWARDTLTPKQILYAATDAWIGRRLYLAMQDTPKLSL